MQAANGPREGRTSNRGRATASVALAAIGAVLVLAGALLLYARVEIIDEDAFAEHASEALHDDQVRELVATEIVVQLIERSSTNLVAARPLLEQAVDTVVDSRPFRDVFREAALQANRLLFVRERNSVAFDVADGLEIVRFGLKSISPQLADSLPRDLDLTLLKLRERAFARESLAVADQIRVLGIAAPLLALVALLASVAIAPDRRTAVLRAALAVAAAGILLAIVYLILRARILAGVIGEDEVTDEDVRGAVGGILDAFLGGLFSWALVLALAGLVIGGAAAAMDPERAEDPASRLRRRITARPRTTAGRAVRGVAALAAGFVVALDPEFALSVAGLLVGAYLVYFGSGELLLLLQPPGAGAEHSAVRKRAFARTGAIAAGAVAVAVIAVVIWVSSGAETRGPGSASPPGGCNGSRAMCDLRLNEAVFAGTHNSFSAADSEDWFIANQQHTIKRQLEDGIRLLLIDPHWGVEDDQGRVRTDFEAEGRDRNRVASAIPPETLAAAERLAGSLGVRAEGGGERDVWLCHTVCELGATRMVDALTDVREFLDRNPGEVVIIFIEPYVPPAEIEKAFERAGLGARTPVLERGAPLPTLGELVRTDRRVVVLTERDADGTVPWYLDGFEFVQDTPLGATEPDQLSCKLNRGTRDSPLLMLNHWADLFPPQRAANEDFQTKREILGRAHRCARERGLPVNLIAVDHYDLGKLTESVAELNRERIEAVGRRDEE